MKPIKSFKINSRIITLIGALFVYLSTLSIEQVEHMLPIEYQYLAPMICIIIGFGAAQWSEEKRIATAKEIYTQEYNEKCAETTDEEGC